MSSLAARTREAVRRHPFLVDALRAGVVNYTAAARFLDSELDGADVDPVVSALRRFADELPAYTSDERPVRLSMESGLTETTDPGDADALFALSGTGFVADGGPLTGVLATGKVDGAALASVLERLRLVGSTPVAAGVAGESLLVVVSRRAGADALRAVEDALADVPDADS